MAPIFSIALAKRKHDMDEPSDIESDSGGTYVYISTYVYVHICNNNHIRTYTHHKYVHMCTCCIIHLIHTHLQCT